MAGLHNFNRSSCSANVSGRFGSSPKYSVGAEPLGRNSFNNRFQHGSDTGRFYQQGNFQQRRGSGYWVPDNFPVFLHGHCFVRLHLFPSEPLVLKGLNSGAVYCHIRENVVIQSEGVPTDSKKDIWEIYSGTTTQGIDIPNEVAIIFKADPTARYRPHPRPEPCGLGLEFDRWFLLLNDCDVDESFQWNNPQGTALNVGVHRKEWDGEVPPIRIFGSHARDRIVKDWLKKIIVRGKRGKPRYSVKRFLKEGRPEYEDIHSVRSFHTEEDCSWLDLVGGEQDLQDIFDIVSGPLPEPNWDVASNWSDFEVQFKDSASEADTPPGTPKSGVEPAQKEAVDIQADSTATSDTYSGFDVFDFALGESANQRTASVKPIHIPFRYSNTEEEAALARKAVDNHSKRFFEEDIATDEPVVSNLLCDSDLKTIKADSPAGCVRLPKVVLASQITRLSKVEEWLDKTVSVDLAPEDSTVEVQPALINLHTELADDTEATFTQNRDVASQTAELQELKEVASGLVEQKLHGPLLVETLKVAVDLLKVVCGVLEDLQHKE